MADMSEMHAHLMCTARLQSAFYERGDARVLAAKSLDHAPMRHCLAAVAGKHRHLGAVGGMSANRCINRSVRARRRAPDQSKIAALHLAAAAMVGELRGERAMRL